MCKQKLNYSFRKEKGQKRKFTKKSNLICVLLTQLLPVQGHV